MPFLNIIPNDAKEPAVLEPGVYQMVIRSVSVEQQKPEKGQSQYLSLGLAATEYPDSSMVFSVLMLPHESVPDQTNNRLRQLNRLCQCFGYDGSNGIDTDALVGLTGNVQLKIEANEQYGDRAVVTRWLAQ